MVYIHKDLACVPGQFLLTRHKPVTLEEATPVKKLPPSDWPVGKFPGHFLDFWLM